MRKWRKDLKSYEEREQEEEDSDKTFLLRYGALCATSLWMSFLGVKHVVNFRRIMEGIYQITTKLEQKCCIGDIG